jgi:hypothetical protein
MTPQVIFVHIEKTAGSSIVKSLIEPNIDDNYRIRRLSSYIQHRDADCIHGHNPYGFHHFTQRPVEYIAMFRDPIDRAVSWYYFIKDLVRVDLWQRHPLRDYADSVTITEFYQNPKFANMQARFMAGLHYHRAYPLMHRSAKFRDALLKAAIRNTRKCKAIGLQERFGESVELFQKAMHWGKYEPVPRQAKTKKRPSLQEINELNPQVLPDLRAAHRLDQRLYDFAGTLFEDQLKEYGVEKVAREGA